MREAPDFVFAEVVASTRLTNEHRLNAAESGALRERSDAIVLIVGEDSLVFRYCLRSICFRNLFSNSSGIGPIIVRDAPDDPAGVFAIGTRQFGLV